MAPARCQPPGAWPPPLEEVMTLVDTICAVDGCDASQTKQGWCGPHYSRWYKFGDPLHPVSKPREYNQVCAVMGCEDPARVRGWCPIHYGRWRRHGDPLVVKKGGRYRRPKSERTFCVIEGCGKPNRGHGLCSAHLSRLRKYGDPTAYRRQPLSNEATTGGYRLVYGQGHPNSHKATGYILEHRLVMSRALGRPLQDDENVHHINGDKLDNRPENLELWVVSQPKGQRVADLLDWAYGIVARYGEGGQQ